MAGGPVAVMSGGRGERVVVGAGGGGEVAVDSQREALLVPVPLHRWRLWSGGFNQAALVAHELARLGGVPHDPHLLRRAKATPSLRGRGRRERERDRKSVV